ncbi:MULTISPECIES: hypothetical protein [unclassified Mesorhizobium]|uniref:hypothetical protein n=1 Tax=unclassified Mesorhizobium TaxID=325217 RepID=UPI000FCB2E9B|nr:MULTISPECIES: hypothetical protein [unclassified Mesorhizobium]RUW87159.1 hypothetical protein EOA35_34580 [Mesorhizobium sp. M8A.F.Ca.ET.023.01.1.1]RVD49548.1 hypothetical protein EN746_20750 [Mesorhizobium sp. M8A.F.Ca.ET.023.02.2.1]TGR58635.1 hypothetical protein EN842_03365 [bacterium M00.F.Ca.ET.199.01.1.1]TGU41257.1 hypothetical protein EN799_01450 [bacterium M00.F.Ca.ET.156.01.1.1]TGU91837.1 hypothetical protein EN794_037490 [Mesorhizobium sp. M00.F.Ca.ET.151.01.1.1]TGV09800.1 hypot
MSKREIGTSPALVRRIAELRARMQDAEISGHEMKTFHKVAAIMGAGDGSLWLDADDMIAASFVVEAAGQASNR